MATLTTLRNSVSKKLGLDNTASSAEQALVDQWCNEGIVEILLRTHCTVETATMDTIADTWEYQLPTSILAMRNIWREDAAGAIDPVIRVTEQEILNYH